MMPTDLLKSTAQFFIQTKNTQKQKMKGQNKGSLRQEADIGEIYLRIEKADSTDVVKDSKNILK